MTVKRGRRIQHREKWADSECILRAEPGNVLMRKRRGRQGWLLAYSLSNWTDRSATDRDKNDRARSQPREGSINRHSISSMLKNELSCGKFQSFIKANDSVIKLQVLITIILSCLMYTLMEMSGSQPDVPVPKRGQA